MFSPFSMENKLIWHFLIDFWMITRKQLKNFNSIVDRFSITHSIIGSSFLCICSVLLKAIYIFCGTVEPLLTFVRETLLLLYKAYVNVEMKLLLNLKIFWNVKLRQFNFLSSAPPPGPNVKLSATFQQFHLGWKPGKTPDALKLVLGDH